MWTEHRVFKRHSVLEPVDVRATQDVPFCDKWIGIPTAGEDGNQV